MSAVSASSALPNLTIEIENDLNEAMDTEEEEEDGGGASVLLEAAGSEGQTGPERRASPAPPVVVGASPRKVPGQEEEDTEEGEISGVEEEMPDEEEEAVNGKAAAKVVVEGALPDRVGKKLYENKDGGFVTGVDVFGEESNAKREERAKRFGIDESAGAVNPEKLRELYESMGIPDEDYELDKPSVQYRLEAIHVRGTQEMSTEDVFAYFKNYGPTSIEWINDCSCNVVWMERTSAARAMIGLTQHVRGLKNRHKDGIDMEDDDPMTGNSVHSSEITVPIPPGPWRLGTESTKAKALLFRFPTRADKKTMGAERMSDYYKKHGNPNYGGIKGIISKTRKQQIKSVSSGGKNPWKGLAEKWGAADKEEPVEEPRRMAVRRMPQRPPRMEEAPPPVRDLRRKMPRSGSESSDDEWTTKLKRPRMRMHADDEERKVVERKKQQQERGRQQQQQQQEERGRQQQQQHERGRQQQQQQERGRQQQRSVESRHQRNAESRQRNVESRLQRTVDTRDLRQRLDREVVLQYETDEDDVEEDAEETQWALEGEDYSDLRDSLARRVPVTEHDDLRSKLNRKRTGQQRAPLQIEIDNDEYYKVIDSSSEEED